MINTEEQSPVAAGSIELLRCVPALAELDESLLHQISAELELVSLGAGEWLFRAGDDARTAYVIASGRLEVVVEGHEEKVIGVLRRGSVIGELALLRGGKRAASVRALRDSSLIALDRDQFEALLRGSPAFSLALTHALAEQLARSAAPATTPRPPRTLAVVPLDDAVASQPAAEALARELEVHVRVAFMSGPPGEHEADWPGLLGRAEAEYDRVVLSAAQCDPTSEWTSFCLREADLIIALSAGEPRTTWYERAASLQECELVLIGVRERDELVARLRPRSVRAVRASAELDKAMSELGRRAGGRAVGVVLSGGGARALAHLGVIEELRRSGVRIDRIAGVSLGAVVAAFVARGDRAEGIYAAFRRSFIDRNPTNDYTLPVVSLIRGRKTARMLSDAFGDARIEGLDMPFFCTSTDLRRRELIIHRTGSVAQAVLASLSIPGVFPPVLDATGRLLVDGGVVDNLPVRSMAAEEGHVIAVDVTGTALGSGATRTGTASFSGRAALRRAITGTDAPLPSLSETIVRCVTFASADTVAAARQYAELVITPDVSGIGLLDWRRLPEMRRAGALAARRALAERPDLAARLVSG